jgi:trimeric autotransporter adhesin
MGRATMAISRVLVLAILCALLGMPAALASDLDRYGPGVVRSLVPAPQGGIYVGGNFETADGILVNHVARWDDGWIPLGQGLTDFETGDSPGTIYALAAGEAGQIYVGGQFKTAGGMPFNNIASWDGEGWSALGSGIDGSVRALVAVGDLLYVGGEFTQAGGASIQHLAVWDRRSGQWSAVGGGVNGPVHALAYADGILYVGGNFDNAGSVPARDVA